MAARNLRSDVKALPSDMDLSDYPGKSRNHKFVAKLLMEAGAEPKWLLSDPERDNELIPAKDIDSEVMTFNAMWAWVPEVIPEGEDGIPARPELSRWADDIQTILMQDGNHKAGHRFGLGELMEPETDKTRFWYPSVAQAARGFYGLPSDESGGLLGEGLVDAIRAGARPTEQTFTEMIQHSPVRTLAVSCDARAPETEPEMLAASLPGAAQALAPHLEQAPLERRIAIRTALLIAAGESLNEEDTEAVALAAAWSGPFGISGDHQREVGADAVPDAVRERARVLRAEVAPVPDAATETLPVCAPTSPAGRVLADALAGWMGHPQMDLVINEQRIAMGVSDGESGMALLERNRQLCTRTKFHTKTGRAQIGKAAKREGTRMCDLMNFVDGGNRKNTAARQLAPA